MTGCIYLQGNNIHRKQDLVSEAKVFQSLKTSSRRRKLSKKKLRVRGGVPLSTKKQKRKVLQKTAAFLMAQFSRYDKGFWVLRFSWHLKSIVRLRYK